MRNYGIKTVQGDRLIWYNETANEQHWHDRFTDQIVRTHQQIETSLPKLVHLLASALPKTGRILEAGSGTGWIVAALLLQGFDIEGVDYSEQLTAEVQAYRPNLPIRTGNVCQLDVPDNYYSGYISLGVIEHRYDGPEPFLKEACRVVEPGGTVCISVPYFNLLRRAKVTLGFYDDTPNGKSFYQYAFSKREFSRFLNDNGFQVQSYIYYGTARNLQEELVPLYSFITRQRLLWRLPRVLDKLDPLGVSHMIMAVAKKR